jgi:hypothetical protein
VLRSADVNGDGMRVFVCLCVSVCLCVHVRINSCDTEVWRGLWTSFVAHCRHHRVVPPPPSKID